MLKNLEKKNYIEISRDTIDKRNIVIKLTEEGKKLRDKAVCVPKTLSEEHWLTEDEFKTFKALLYKLLEGEW